MNITLVSYKATSNKTRIMNFLGFAGYILSVWGVGLTDKEMFFMSWTNGQSVRTNQPPFMESTGDDRTFTSQSTTYAQQGNYKKTHRPYPSQPNKDVAATFTQEGLQTFATIFSTAVEAVLVKTLPELVEKVLDKKVEELSKQLLLEMHHLLKSQLTTSQVPSESTEQPGIARDNGNFHFGETIMQDRSDSTSVQSQNWGVEAGLGLAPYNSLNSLSQTPPTTGSSQVAVHSGPIQQPSRLIDDLKRVIGSLQHLDRPVRTNELPELVPEVYWGHNISMKMNKIMQKSEGRIQRISKGLYVYKNDLGDN